MGLRDSIVSVAASWLSTAACTVGIASSGSASPPPPGSPASGTADQPISLNLPDNVELKVLIDYVSQRLGINFYFDEQAVSQHVTLRAPSPVVERDLLPLLESVLQSRGLAVVDAEQPGWKRIVPAANLLQNASTQPSATTRPTSVITEVFTLRSLSAERVEATIKPLLTQPGGSAIAVPEQHLLIVTDFASVIHRVSQIIHLLDQANSPVVTQFIQVTNVDATQLLPQVNSLLAATAKASGQAASDTQLEIVPDARANRLILVGTANACDAAAAVIRSFDIRLPVETKAYRFRSVSADRIDRLAKGLMASVPSQYAYTSTVDPESATLVVTGTAAAHVQVELLRHQFDVPVEQNEQSPIRFYKLQNSTAAQVIATIEAITGEGSPTNLSIGGSPSPAPSQPAPTSVAASPITAGLPPEGGAANGSPLAPETAVASPPKTVRAKDATITADANTNTIIVVASPANQYIYEQLIKMLDKRRPQVLVECTVVTLDTTGNYQFGVEISGRGGGGSTDVVTFSSFGLSTVGRSVPAAHAAPSPGDLGRLTLTPGVGFNGAIIAPDIADVVVRALTGSSRARVVSAPRLLVNDNIAATLASVTEAPFTTTSALTGNTSSTSFGGFAQAGTTITITPHISEGDQLQLEYSIALNSFTQEPQTGASTPPPRRSNQLQSKVTVPDGSTIVVGGLKLRSDTSSKSGLPVLSQIPVLEYLFSNRTASQTESTLFVFIRPVILRDDAFADLKFFSERDARAAAIAPDEPSSLPLLMR